MSSVRFKFLLIRLSFTVLHIAQSHHPSSEVHFASRKGAFSPAARNTIDYKYYCPQVVYIIRQYDIYYSYQVVFGAVLPLCVRVVVGLRSGGPAARAATCNKRGALVGLVVCACRHVRRKPGQLDSALRQQGQSLGPLYPGAGPGTARAPYEGNRKGLVNSLPRMLNYA